MTVSLLLAAQAALHSQIQARAIELGHDSEKIRPVYDGVVDEEAYLAAKPETTVKRGAAIVDVHEWRGKRLLWTPHPAAHLPPEKWVDAVIEAAR